jgi:hypothetical protein
MTLELSIQAFVGPISLFGKKCHLSGKKCRIFHRRACYDASVDQQKSKEKKMNARRLVFTVLMSACFLLSACTIGPDQCLPSSARPQHAAPKSGTSVQCYLPSTAAASTVIDASRPRSKQTLLLSTGINMHYVEIGLSAGEPILHAQ